MHLMKPVTFLLFLGCLMTSTAFGGGIRGLIKGDDGASLAFATIFVKQTGTGSATDLQGHYEVTLAPGSYDILFQYLGYESVVRKIDVKDNFIEINITLKTQVVML